MYIYIYTLLNAAHYTQPFCTVVRVNAYVTGRHSSSAVPVLVTEHNYIYIYIYIYIYVCVCVYIHICICGVYVFVFVAINAYL